MFISKFILRDIRSDKTEFLDRYQVSQSRIISTALSFYRFLSITQVSSSEAFRKYLSVTQLNYLQHLMRNLDKLSPHIMSRTKTELAFLLIDHPLQIPEKYNLVKHYSTLNLSWPLIGKYDMGTTYLTFWR